VSDPAFLPMPGRPGEGRQVAVLLDIARSQVDEAFRVSEFLETKARHLLQAATILFAGSQAAVGIQIAASSGRASAPFWVGAVALFIGIIGLLGVVMTAVCFVRLQEPANQKAVSVETLCVRLLPHAEDDDPRVPRYILSEMSKIVRARREKNEDKAVALEDVQFWTFVALGSSATALLFGLFAAYFLR
jgi:hypothetical protein